MELLQQINNKQQEFIATVEAKAENARIFSKEFMNALTSLWKKYPDAVGITWEQFIPYFNDGEACTFTMGEIRIVFPLEYDMSNSDVFCEPVECYFADKEYVSYEIYWKATRTESYKEVVRVITQNYELCQFLFGEYAEVFIDKEGLIIINEIVAPY